MHFNSAQMQPDRSYATGTNTKKDCVKGCIAICIHTYRHTVGFPETTECCWCNLCLLQCERSLKMDDRVHYTYAKGCLLYHFSMWKSHVKVAFIHGGHDICTAWKWMHIVLYSLSKYRECMDMPFLAKNKADDHSLCGIWLVCSSFTNVCVCQSSTVILYVERRLQQLWTGRFIAFIFYFSLRFSAVRN